MTKSEHARWVESHKKFMELMSRPSKGFPRRHLIEAIRQVMDRDMELSAEEQVWALETIVQQMQQSIKDYPRIKEQTRLYDYEKMMEETK